jgi:hypothetical protein
MSVSSFIPGMCPVPTGAVKGGGPVRVESDRGMRDGTRGELTLMQLAGQPFPTMGGSVYYEQGSGAA